MTRRHLDLRGSVVPIEFSADERATELALSEKDIQPFVMEVDRWAPPLSSEEAARLLEDES
ncbi:MAG TPA: hypothetical protein VGN42_27715 [Pirellulales bacterium]|nr:hypothetical protein [Pirellulales bacterium]